jgi:potassium-dependent mechanosensitive channel
MCWRIVFVWTTSIGLCALTSFAQQDSKQDGLTIVALQKRIKIVEGNQDLAGGLRDKILQYLRDAADRLEIAREQTEKAERFEKRLSQVVVTLQATENRLASSPTAVDPAIASVSDMNELERMVETRTRQLDEPKDGLRKHIEILETEAAMWRIRPEELVNELAEVDDRLREIDDELDGLATSGEPHELLQSHQAFLLARRQRAQAERRALQAEAAWFQSAAAADLVQVQRELASRELAVKIAELELLQNELGKRRGNEADQRVRRAETVLDYTALEYKSLAQRNLELAKERREITTKLQELDQRHEAATTTLLDLEKEFERTQAMVKDIGLTDSIGLLLRQQRAKLLNPRGMRSNLLHRNDVVREVRMRLFELDADRLSLVDLDAASARYAADLDTSNQRKSTSAGLKSLLADRRQLVKGLDADYTKYFQHLVDMDNVERRLLDLTSKYTDYVDERVLWIRTGQSFGREHFDRMRSSIGWISDRPSLRAVVEAGRMNAARLPISWACAVGMLVVWFCCRPVLKTLVQRRGAIAAAITCRDLLPTLQATSLTVLIASGWPLFVWFLGWRLDHSASTVPFVHAVAAGLLRAARFAFPLEILRVACMRGGLAEQHFEWPERSIVMWRRNLGWFLPFGLLLVGLIGLTEGTGDEHRLDSFGRFVFLVFAALTAVFCQLTIRRASSSSAREVENDKSITEPDVWSDRFWRFAPIMAVGVSLGLFALGWSGFFYTALQLTWRLQSTAWLLVGLLMFRAVIRRWISLERRRMAVLQAAELQSITDAERSPGNTERNPFLFPRWTWPDFRLNLTQIVSQMRSLLDTGLIAIAVAGLWFVWADVTPALNILDRFTLWNTAIEQVVYTEDSEHATVGKTVTRLIPVTAANLGVAVLVAAISVIAGRNIPGLVEVILLEHLAVDAGTRFAATCLVRYAIFVAGAFCAFAQIRIGWSNVQWLVAAASVGLGFGLQEIFGNFVSGIILLFERPMRVGDVITVGDTTGTVSRIRFRATTIVDGDRKELIVPNKEFITGKLLNWTLSDQVNRFAVKVIVSSHNDPNRVRRILTEIASHQANLLKTPAPVVSLEEINGGLTFVLRAFLPTLDERTGAINDLYSVIHKRFISEGIEMSRASQDVFVHTEVHDVHPSSPPPPHSFGITPDRHPVSTTSKEGLT